MRISRQRGVGGITKGQAVTYTLLFVLASSCAVKQAKFEATPGSTRQAVLQGEVKEAMALHEAKARDAEQAAAASHSPQQYWEAAHKAYQQAAIAAVASGQLQKAITFSLKTLENAEKTKEPVYQLRAINTLIEAYRAVRNFEKARELIDRGLIITKRLPPDTIGRLSTERSLYVQLGTILMQQGQHDKASDSFSRALDSGKKVLGLVSSSRRWKPPRTGLRTRTEALEQHRNKTIDILIRLGDAYLEAGKVQQALEQYQGAFNSIKEWGLNYASEGDLYESVGKLYLRQRGFSQALENFQKALALAEGQQSPPAISSASRLIGNVFHQTGRLAESIFSYQRAIQQIESTRALLQSEEYRQSFFEGGLNVYVSMMNVLLEAGKQEEVFNYSERSRSRVFLDILGSRVQLSRVKSSLLEEESALQERMAAIRAKLAGEGDGETDKAGLRGELAEAEKAYSAFLARVRKEDKEQSSLMTVEPLTLKEVQGLLDPGTTLIEYFVGGPMTFVWVVEKEKFQFVRLELSKEKLAGLVKALRESIYTLGEKDKFQEVSTFLYTFLIQPVFPHVTGRELIIVPHDVLHYLPFHALLSADGKYLIEKYPIYYLSSASLLQFTKEKRKAGRGERVLALGNPDLGDPKMNLDFAELEAKEIQGLYPQSTVLLKREATEEKSKTLSPQNDIIHFATHAELDENDPLSSAVLLTKDGREDGRLEVREIFGMDLKANLVVLSACETGLGKLSSGDELVGLTRAFIYAGTPSVVASLWKVEDSSTAALMASFYKNLKTMSKVDALRQAQLELIRGQARSDLLARRGIGGVGKLGETPGAMPSAPSSVPTSHPYFWAPFILVGDGK